MKREKKFLTKGAASGIVALIFLILGFQLAVFFMKVVQKPTSETAAENTIQESVKESPKQSKQQASGQSRAAAKHKPSYSKSALGGYVTKDQRSYESFPFDPNTVSVDSLVLLGLTRKQAESIENYRSKGGKFRKPEDFAKMYVVTDTLYARISPFIKIRKLDLNSADSSALVGLNGIGPYYARRIMEYRTALGGFSNLDQLLEIRGIDSEKIDGFRESVWLDSSRITRFDLWHSSDSILACHPYIGEKKLRRIVRFKSVYDTTQWNYSNLIRDNVLDTATLSRLKAYLLKKECPDCFN